MHRMLSIVAMIAVVMLISSCKATPEKAPNASTPSPNTNTTTEKAIPSPTSDDPSSPSAKEATHSDFQAFWIDFKKAINEGDKDAVAKMTNIPFKDTYREELSKDVQGLGKPRTSNSVDDFKTNYNSIFTPQIVKLIKSDGYIGWESKHKRDRLGNSANRLRKGEYLLLTGDQGEGLLFGKKDGIYLLLSIPRMYDTTLDSI